MFSSYDNKDNDNRNPSLLDNIDIRNLLNRSSAYKPNKYSIFKPEMPLPIPESKSFDFTSNIITEQPQVNDDSFIKKRSPVETFQNFTNMDAGLMSAFGNTLTPQKTDELIKDVKSTILTTDDIGKAEFANNIYVYMSGLMELWKDVAIVINTEDIKNFIINFLWGTTFRNKALQDMLNKSATNISEIVSKNKFKNFYDYGDKISSFLNISKSKYPDQFLTFINEQSEQLIGLIYSSINMYSEQTSKMLVRIFKLFGNNENFIRACLLNILNGISDNIYPENFLQQIKSKFKIISPNEYDKFSELVNDISDFHNSLINS